MKCGRNTDTNLLLICDLCNYNVCHTYSDGLDMIPGGNWYCSECKKQTIKEMSFFRNSIKSPTPNDTETEKKRYITESYKQNCKLANKFKTQWEHRGDPILQRGEQYIPKEKSIQPCKLTYIQRMKEKENSQKANLVITKYDIAQQESDGIIKFKTKRFYAPEVIKREEKEKKPEIRVYPQLYQKAKAGYIIEEKGEIQRQNNIRRIDKSYYKPSDDYVKMNNKYNFLPSQIEDKQPSFKNSLKNQFNKENLVSTKNRVFNVQDEPNKRPQSAKQRLVHKIEVKEKIDHMNELLGYQNSMNFKEQNYTEKPNRVNFTHLVNRTIQNINENFVTDPYRYK